MPPDVTDEKLFVAMVSWWLSGFEIRAVMFLQEIYIWNIGMGCSYKYTCASGFYGVLCIPHFVYMKWRDFLRPSLCAMILGLTRTYILSVKKFELWQHVSLENVRDQQESSEISSNMNNQIHPFQILEHFTHFRNIFEISNEHKTYIHPFQIPVSEAFRSWDHPLGPAEQPMKKPMPPRALIFPS